MVGTDLSDGRIFPGFSVHEELAMLVGAGLSPMDALRAATLTRPILEAVRRRV
jgi:imidazolonepropionase-like amidohydrolase